MRLPTGCPAAKPSPHPDFLVEGASLNNERTIMIRANGKRRADTVVVLDFETSGLSPNTGDRAIEIGAVRIENGILTDRFQELMNPGFRISGFIESYTGITNAMLKSAPPCGEVMARFAEFIDGDNLVAHNASFDRRFLDAELDEIGQGYSGNIACSMLVARRLFQDAPNHKLESLVQFLSIETDGTFHRALADSEMTARLWLAMVDRLRDQYEIPEPSFSLMKTISRTCKAAVHRVLESSGKQGVKGSRVQGGKGDR
jgi:DNA polymerase-3 subunit epsilon